MEAMLFNSETTYKTSYKGHDIKPPIYTLYEKKPKQIGQKYKPLKDVHTLTDWKAEAIPFHFLHRPKLITGTNPMNIQQKYEMPQDLERENVQKTRPRLVMTPAVSMDDIDNKTTRKILCEDIYRSEMSRALKEAVFPYFSVRAPFTGHPSPSNPITLPKVQAAYISPEWRMDSVYRNTSQLRSFCDPTRDFWLAQEPPRCKACDESAVIRSNIRKTQTMKIVKP